MDEMYDSYKPCLNRLQESQEDHESELEQSYEQDSNEQTEGSEAHQQNSLHPYQLDPRISSVSQHEADNVRSLPFPTGP